MNVHLSILQIRIIHHCNVSQTHFLANLRGYLGGKITHHTLFAQEINSFLLLFY